MGQFSIDGQDSWLLDTSSCPPKSRQSPLDLLGSDLSYPNYRKSTSRNHHQIAKFRRVSSAHRSRCTKSAHILHSSESRTLCTPSPIRTIKVFSRSVFIESRVCTFEQSFLQFSTEICFTSSSLLGFLTQVMVLHLSPSGEGQVSPIYNKVKSLKSAFSTQEFNENSKLHNSSRILLVDEASNKIVLERSKYYWNKTSPKSIL